MYEKLFVKGFSSVLSTPIEYTDDSQVTASSAHILRVFDGFCTFSSSVWQDPQV